MLDLRDYLTPLDKKRISNYITLFGTEVNYIGNNEWLQSWSDNNKKLFRLLGGKLIVKTPVSYGKQESVIENELIKLYDRSRFIGYFLTMLYTASREGDLDRDTLLKLEYDVLTKSIFKKQIYEGKKLTINLKTQKKAFQINTGQKVIRIYNKLGKYFQNYIPKELSITEFNKMRVDFVNDYSLIFNDTLKGNLCFSIHPLDFLTMSDNNLDWSSCMSWRRKGCYQIGPEEMMNSNNVICCYIEAKTPFYFYGDNQEEQFTWNNKRWRQLFYVTKEIIAGGKAYPYQLEVLTKDILSRLRDLAAANWNHEYQYGIEKYSDMNHIGSNARMLHNYSWIKNKQTTKHNIIFDTRGMYNDFFNDHYNTTYWCIRNKVKKNTIINVSGKTKCLCCGKPVIKKDDVIYENNDEDAYNERYSRHNELICDFCADINRCSLCYSAQYKTIKFNGISNRWNNEKICRDCWENNVVKCPICGKVCIPKRSPTLQDSILLKTPDAQKITLNNAYIYTSNLLCCDLCYKELKNSDKVYKQTIGWVNTEWGPDRELIFLKDKYFKEFKPYTFRKNLEKVPLPKELKLIF